MAHRNVGRSIPYFKIEQAGCHRDSPKGSFMQNTLGLAKLILADFAYAVITSICEIGVGIGIQRLRNFLTMNHIVMATDYPDFDSGYTARCPASRAKRFNAQAECKCSSDGVLMRSGRERSRKQLLLQSKKVPDLFRVITIECPVLWPVSLMVRFSTTTRREHKTFSNAALAGSFNSYFCLSILAVQSADTYAVFFLVRQRPSDCGFNRRGQSYRPSAQGNCRDPSQEHDLG